MTTITNLKELKKRKILKYEDIVVFTVKKEIIKYEAKLIFLENLKNISPRDNDRIFRILKIDKWKLAEKIYKHEPRNKKTHNNPNQWPETKNTDFPALTRLVKELYLIIEEKEIIFTKFARFEIMEI